MKFDVPKMSCGHCVGAITSELETADKDAKVNANLETRSIEIETNLDPNDVIKAISRAGYEATPS